MTPEMPPATERWLGAFLRSKWRIFSQSTKKAEHRFRWVGHPPRRVHATLLAHTGQVGASPVAHSVSARMLSSFTFLHSTVTGKPSASTVHACVRKLFGLLSR